MTTTKRIPRGGIVAVMLLVALILTAAGMGIARASTAAPEPAAPAPLVLESLAPQPEAVPVPSNQFGLLGVNAFTDLQKRESYQAAADGELGIQAFMNAVDTLADGTIGGQPLTEYQLNALLLQGLDGLNLAQARVADALAVLGITQATLDAQAATNPVPGATWCSVTPEVCDESTP